MSEKILYYPGCTLKSDAKEFDETSKKLFKYLGYDIKELDRWNCCGTVYSLASDNVMFHVASFRNLIRAKEEGADKILCMCSMCYNTLKRVDLLVKRDKEKMDKINDLMYEEETKYDGGVEVIHGLHLLKEFGFDKLGQMVKKKIGKKVAPYYGCMLLRPEEVALDDPENPHILSDLIKAIGGEPVEFPFMNECCGSYQVVNEKEFVIERAHKILKSAIDRGAEILITSCPLCHYNLKNFQDFIKENYPDFTGIEVKYFTELICEALSI